MSVFSLSIERDGKLVNGRSLVNYNGRSPKVSETHSIFFIT